MKVKDAIKKAVKERDCELFGKIADILRFRFRLNYDESYKLINKIEPISKRRYEEMLYESEM